MTSERLLQRVTAVAWLLPTALALHGAWRGRAFSGRKVGTPFAELPTLLLAATLPIYVGLLARFWRPMPTPASPCARICLNIVGTALSVLGIALIVCGRLALGNVYNVSSAFGVRLHESHHLVTNGPFRFVRHPMYLGAFIGGAGSVLLYRTWTMVFILAHCAVFVVRARREEQALAEEFGAAWQEYERRVPAWIPRLDLSPLRKSRPARQYASETQRGHGRPDHPRARA